MSVGEVIKLKEEPFLLRQRGGKNSVPYTVGTSILLGSFFEGSNTGFVPVVLFSSGGGLFRRGEGGGRGQKKTVIPTAAADADRGGFEEKKEETPLTAKGLLTDADRQSITLRKCTENVSNLVRILTQNIQ